MITIIFETHSMTVDNEAQLAAGWYDVALSDLGEQQAKQLGERRAGQHFDAIFCSDLQRSFLDDLAANYDGKTVLIVGHRATQYGLDQWIKGMSLKNAVLAPWQWQPGWTYEFKK